MAKDLYPHGKEINDLLKDVIKILNEPNVSISKIHGSWYRVSGNGRHFAVFCEAAVYGLSTSGGSYTLLRVALELGGDEKIHATYADKDVLNSFSKTFFKKYNECWKREEYQAQKKAQEKMKNFVSSMCSQNSKS